MNELKVSDRSKIDDDDDDDGIELIRRMIANTPKPEPVKPKKRGRPKKNN